MDDYMMERFEEIFWEVADALGIHAWWELYDSKQFDEVDRRLEAEFGPAIFETEEYEEWNAEMADEL